MAAEFGAGAVFEMDVASDESIAAAFATLGKKWDSLDIVVHAVAFAPSDAIRGGFVESTTRENFRIAHDISSYSLTALAKAAEPMLRGRAGALLTLTYLGAVRSVPNYNVMGVAKASLEASVRFLAADLGPKGIRVNAISAGPIKTLAAAGIAGFRKMLESRGGRRAAAPQRHDRRRRQHRRVPVLRPGGRHHRRSDLRRRRLQQRRHVVRRRAKSSCSPTYSNSLSFLTIFVVRSASPTYAANSSLPPAPPRGACALFFSAAASLDGSALRTCVTA